MAHETFRRNGHQSHSWEKYLNNESGLLKWRFNFLITTVVEDVRRVSLRGQLWQLCCGGYSLRLRSFRTFVVVVDRSFWLWISFDCETENVCGKRVLDSDQCAFNPLDQILHHTKLWCYLHWTTKLLLF